MAVTTPYTTEALITRLVGRLGIELREDDADDADDEADMMQDAIDTGTDDLDYYLQKYNPTDIAASNWAQQHATWFAVRRWCLRRLNDVPESVLKECERREKQLDLIRQGKAVAPRLPKTRRPVAVTNHHVDLRPFNNTIRVDRTRSTGAAKNYNRPADNAPDDR